MDREPFALGHRPSLDGLRAVAILAVLGFHLGIATELPKGRSAATRVAESVVFHARGGYVGVQVFFVLSGFLITALLVAERERRGRVSLGSFYARRALRLLPAVVVLVGMCAVYVIVSAPAPETAGFWGDALSTLLYYANWAAAVQPQFSLHLLSQTWSLSIEEQFYLLWPLTLGLLARRLRRRAIIAAVLCGAVASTVTRSVLWHRGATATRVYYGLDTRGDALLLGCALGLVVAWGWIPNRWTQGAVTRAVAIGAVVFLGIVIVEPGRFAGPLVRDQIDWVLPLSAVASALLILAVIAHPYGLISRVLALPPLVWVGRLSYSLYLWHFPAFVVLTSRRTGLPLFPLLVVRLIAAFAAAACSYYGVERPFLRRKDLLGAQTRGQVAASS